MENEDKLTGEARNKCILATIEDMFTMWLYYDRKEDYALPVDSIEEAVKVGDITKDEIILAFHRQIEENFA